MKQLMFLFLILSMFSFTNPISNTVDDSTLGVSLRIYNKDSKDHEFKVKIGSHTKTLKVKRSRTAMVTIQGSSRDAVIYTDCGEIKVKDNQKITIKKGCIKIN